MKRFDKTKNIQRLNESLNKKKNNLTEDFGGGKEYYDHILQGHEATEENAYDHARGIDWMAVETTPQNLPNLDFIDSVNGVEIYYDHGADYYCFSPAEGDMGTMGESKKPKSLSVLNEASKTVFEKLCGVKVIKEAANTDLELKSVAKQIFAILKKYQLKPQYNTGEISQFTSNAPAKGYGAILTLGNNGVLGVGVYDRGLWGTLKENTLQELDMGAVSNPSPEEQKQIDQKANMIYKEIVTTLGQDKFEFKANSGTNEYGYYIIHIMSK